MDARWTGAILDAELNAGAKGCISAETSPISVLVIRTDEERLIARHTMRRFGICSV